MCCACWSPIAHGEGHQLRRGELRGEDQVAFVLSVGGVGDDNGVPGGDLSDCSLDRRDGVWVPQRVLSSSTGSVAVPGVAVPTMVVDELFAPKRMRGRR